MHHEEVTTTRVCRTGLSVIVALLACGCDDAGDYALYVGGDLTPDGGATVVDATVSARGDEVPVPDATAPAVPVDARHANADAGDAASFVYWAEWQSVDGGTVSGRLSPPSGVVQAVYSGDVFAVQTTTGTNQFTPATTFTSATVADAPPGPGMIEESGESTLMDSVTFSRPVTNPVLAIYNLGTGYAEVTASIFFSEPVTVLSSGPNAAGVSYFGSERLVPVDGGVSGVGSNGVVELEGTFSTIHWTNPNDTPYASYTGLTVGIRGER